MRKMTTPPSLSIRLTDGDREVLTSAAADAGLPVTTFVRRSALAAANRRLGPPTVVVGTEVVPLLDTLEVP